MISWKIKLFTALLAVFGAAGLYGANFQALMKLEYEYSRSGKITARIINGVRHMGQNLRNIIFHGTVTSLKE